jgi:hypothetical protein
VEHVFLGIGQAGLAHQAEDGVVPVGQPGPVGRRQVTRAPPDEDPPMRTGTGAAQRAALPVETFGSFFAGCGVALAAPCGSIRPCTRSV